MNRPGTVDDPAQPPANAEYAQVASLAAKIAATSRNPPSNDDAHNQSSYAKTRSGLRRWLGALVYLLLWMVTITLAVIAALRIFNHDGTFLLIWLNAFTRYVYLPAYVCLALALLMRRRWLAAANLAIITCHLWWISPDFLRDHRFDLAPGNRSAAVHKAKTVRIFFANVRYLNTADKAYLQEIKEANPDIVVLVEFSLRWQQPFRNSPVMAAYPYGTASSPAQIASVVIYSKFPVKSETRDWFADREIQVLEIPIGSQTLRLVGLHSPRPMQIHHNNYAGFWDRALPLLLAQRGPLVVVGDFNATQYSLVYEKLKAGSLRSAHEDRGRGYATTWPNGMLLLPPIRIDQALLSPEIECLGIREGEGRGSDHKPLILDVQIRGNS